MVLDRRGFMKFMAGAGAGIMATPLPWQLLDDVSIWSQNWSWIPSVPRGVSTYVNAVSKTCPSSVAMKIRMVNGQAVRVLPDEAHPLGGGISALAVAEAQLLHSPARVRRPLKRSADGAYTAITWDEAKALLLAKLKEAGKKVAFVSGDETGSINEVISAFAGSIGSEQAFLMPSDAQCAAKASALMGLNAQLGYDLENSDYVLSIGANILETWGTVVRNRRIFGNANPHPAPGAKASASLVYAGPVQNSTASVAKPWLPILPGTEAVFALGLAHLLISKGRSVAAPDFAAFKALVAKYTPEETAKLTGVKAETLKLVADALLNAKAPLVVVGSEFNQGGGAAPVMAGVAVNALLGNINKKGGLNLLPEAPTVLAGAKSRAALYQNDFTAYLAGKQQPAVLVMYEANPLYALPEPKVVKAALQAIPFKVSFTTFMDETAALCDLVLPQAMGLERLDDIITPYGFGQALYCCTYPVMAPSDQIGNAGDILLALAKSLGKDLGEAKYEAVLKAKAKAMGANPDVLKKGNPFIGKETVALGDIALRPEILAKVQTGVGKDTLRIAVYSKLSMGTAKTGIPPFNTKTIRAQELAGTEMYVMMNKATAGKKGLAQDDRVTLKSGHGVVRARVRLFEGVMHDTIAVSTGFGHTAFDEFSKNKGANIMELLQPSVEPETGLTVWAQAGVEVAKA